MSRVKKSRSLKRVTGGVKTGSKERTKLENKQRKAKKKSAQPSKTGRQRSVYQKFLDDNNLIEKQHVSKPVKPVIEVTTEETVTAKPERTRERSENLWDQLEKPTSNDIF